MAEEATRPPPVRRNVFLAVTMALVIFALYTIRLALLPFIIAGVVSLMFDPLIEWLHPRVRRRWIGAVLVLFALLLVAAAFGYTAGSILFGEVSRLVQQAPHLLSSGLEQLAGPNGVSVFGETYSAQNLTKTIETHVGSVLGPGALAAAGTVAAEMVLGLILTLVLLAYFLIDGRRIGATLLWLVPPRRRPPVRHELTSIIPLLRRYFIGVCIVVLFTAIAAYIGFGLIFGLPHALLLSMVVGVLEIIPALGPATSMALVFVSAIEAGGVGWSTVLPMGYAIALRLVIDNGVGPFVLGASARLHPVAIIFAFVIGGSLLGLLGLLLAVPATATLILILDHHYREHEELSGGSEAGHDTKQSRADAA